MIDIMPEAQPDLSAAIRSVMHGNSITAFIAVSVRMEYSHHRKVTTPQVRARLMKMEKRGEVCRVPYCPRSQPYKKQIAWKLVPPNFL
jgi:hypothetical protein